jgi:hypothetical protein
LKGREPDAARRALVRPRQCVELGGGLDPGPDRIGVVAAEDADPSEPDFEGVHRNAGEAVDELVGLRFLDVAAEAQGQVIVVGLGPPAAARQRHAQPEKSLALLCGDLDAGEEARHDVAFAS